MPRTDLIRAANRMGRLIDLRRPKGLTDKQKESLLQEAEIKELYYRRDQLHNSIRSEFKFLYRAEGEPTYNEYQKAKHEVERVIKVREWALKKQIQAEYDATAPVNDIQAQLEGTTKSVYGTFPITEPIQYAFVERSHIAKAFFDPPSTLSTHDNLDWRVSIVNDLVSLCALREGHFRKAHSKQKTRATNGYSDDYNPDNTSDFIKSGSGSHLPQVFPQRCKPYQCLHCISNHTLPPEERFHNLGSKFSLRRHFSRCHTFRPGQSCPFPHPECATLILNSIMHFKNHAAKVHGIYMSEKA